MAYTTARTWVTSELVTASIMNTHVRDNLTAIWVGTTAGDVDYYTSGTAKARVAIGGAGTYLQSSGTAPQWAGLSLYKSGANTAITNSEVTVLTTSIAGGTLGTAGILWCRLVGTITQDVGGDDKITVSLKYGATTVATKMAEQDLVEATWFWKMDAYLVSMGATNSQYGWFDFHARTQTGSTARIQNVYDDGTASEDSTAAKTLAVTMQFDGTGISGACRVAQVTVL